MVLTFEYALLLRPYDILIASINHDKNQHLFWQLSIRTFLHSVVIECIFRSIFCFHVMSVWNERNGRFHCKAVCMCVCENASSMQWHACIVENRFSSIRRRALITCHPSLFYPYLSIWAWTSTKKSKNGHTCMMMEPFSHLAVIIAFRQPIVRVQSTAPVSW